VAKRPLASYAGLEMMDEDSSAQTIGRWTFVTCAGLVGEGIVPVW
jgi:hypothetical protein